MRRLTALILAALLIAPCAHAQQPAPAPLPPPILVPNVNPPLTIPSEVVAELQNGRILCERKLAKFDINLNHLKRADFNGDGAEDFILSTAGYLCNNSNTEFASLTGDEYFIFASLPGGKYQRHGEAVRAFEMTIDNGFTPPHLLFTVQCPHKFGREFAGHTRLRWNGNQLKTVVRNAGCDGTPADASVAAAPAGPDAAPISSGPRINRTSTPGMELDITHIDQDTVAAPMVADAPAAPEAPPSAAEELPDVTMTPEPPAPTAPAPLAEEISPAPAPETITEATVKSAIETQPEPQPAPQPEPEPAPAPVAAKAPTVSSPPATLPGATFPDLSAPLPAPQPVQAPPAAPSLLSTEDLLNAPVKQPVKKDNIPKPSTGFNE